VDRNNKMGTEKITRLLLQFSLPAIVGMLVNALYNIVDRIFIGNSAELGTLGLAGLTISFPIMMIMMALAVLFGIGGATLFSIRLGEGKPEEAERVLGLTSLLLILSALTLTVVGNIYLESLLKAFGASEAVLPHAMEYMRIILLGAVFQGISMGGNNFIRADGSPKIAMLTMFLGAGFNILFDPLLIYVFGWGMAGAAIATVGGWVLTSIWVGFYFYGSKSKSAAKFKPENARFRSGFGPAHYPHRCSCLYDAGFQQRAQRSIEQKFGILRGRYCRLWYGHYQRYSNHNDYATDWD
jgi:Na+-driven multidrug efflux pump